MSVGRLAVTLTIVVIAVWCASFLVVRTIYGTPGDPASFGDSFGAVESLFSGLAFVGVILAIVLQAKELQLQREELKATREELAGQKEQLRAQNETLRKQSFESTFFQLVRLHGDIVAGMETKATNRPSRTGRDCFTQYYGRFRFIYESRKKASPHETPELMIIRAYDEFYQGHQALVGHYFRSFYNIVKLLDNSDVPGKKIYSNLLRAQLSSQELLLLFYNGLSRYGKDKAKLLIERFSMLKSVPIEQLLDSSHVILYDREAFGSSALPLGAG